MQGFGVKVSLSCPARSKTRSLTFIARFGRNSCLARPPRLQADVSTHLADVMVMLTATMDLTRTADMNAETSWPWSRPGLLVASRRDV